MGIDLLHLSTFELRQICYFLTVVEAGNVISHAAERLNIEQPPLSQRIRSLEKQLHVQLFDRKQRPMRLTPAGKVFLHDVKLAIAHLDRAITQARRAEQGEVGTLRIGIASSIANSMLPDLLRQFRHRYPDVDLDLHHLTAEQQLKALGDRQLDIGFEVVPDEVLQSDIFHCIPVVTESLVVVLPTEHILAKKQTIDLLDLADEPLLLPSIQAFPFYETFIQHCQQAGFQPNLVKTTTATWMLTLLSLVAAGIGLAILPSNVCVLKREGVIFKAIANLNISRQIYAIWRSDNPSTVLAHFLKGIQPHP